MGPNETRQVVIASRASMREASPMWRNWLDNNTSPMDFPDAPKNALLLILRLIHYQWDELPVLDDLSLDELLDIARVCNNYAVVHVVKPFLVHRKWTSSVRFDCTAHNHQAALYITGTFDYAEGYAMSARYLATTMCLDEDEAVVFEKGKRRDDIYLQWDHFGTSCASSYLLSQPESDKQGSRSAPPDYCSHGRSVSTNRDRSRYRQFLPNEPTNSSLYHRHPRCVHGVAR